MKKNYFDEEEIFTIAIFDQDERTNAIEIMSALLPELNDDPEMHALVYSTIEKLKRISDQDYKALPLADYLADFEEFADAKEEMEGDDTE